jgi:DNA-binding MarR family transcriptional regulator
MADSPKRVRRNRGLSDDELLDNIGVAFSKLRRRTLEVPVDPPAAPTDLRRDLVLTAIEQSDLDLTVKSLAHALAQDQSAASRLTTWCVNQGLVERVASQADGRSVLLRLTEHGREVLQHSRHQQRQAFEYITRNWSKHDQVELARLLHRYTDATANLSPPDTDTTNPE